jgi:hypothetical protein
VAVQNQHIEPEVYKAILSRLEVWSKRVDRLSNFLITGGVITITTSLFITAFVGNLGEHEIIIIRVVAFVSALTLTLMTAFNVSKKLSDIRNAWRYLNKAIYSFKNNTIGAEELLKAYDEAENMVGSVDFNYKQSSRLP